MTLTFSPLSPPQHLVSKNDAAKVLTKGASSYASDVYSFGIVVWEVLSREVPWAGVSDIQDLYRLVFFQDTRPEVPAGAAHDLAAVARACWVAEPSKRPTFKQVIARVKPRGWEDAHGRVR